MKLAQTLGLVVLAHMLACGTPSPKAPPSMGDTAMARGTFRMAGSVGTYVSTPWTFSTNAFVLRGPTGLVVVDTGFTPSQAAQLVEDAESATGKKVVLAVVLHANPDKFNGTETLQRHGVRVVTSKQVADRIPDVYRQRTQAFAPRYAPDWPTRVPAPEVFGDATTDLDAAGLHVRLHVLGPACSAAHVALEWDADDGRHLFVGDAVAQGTHSWLELGLVDEWLAQLDALRARQPRFVHPGRGESGGAELLDAETRYLKDVVALVDAEAPVMPMPRAGAERVKSALQMKYPGYGFEVFLDVGLPAVWERRAKDRAMALPSR
jgi:glyoxylase-like metal-dependent hydrolase (beta-lactamase superfamily II)